MKNNYIDVHCHVLPGIDDGPKDIHVTKQLLQQCWDEGIQTVVATSHYRQDYWKFDISDYDKAFEQAVKIAKEISPDFHLIPGSEVYCQKGLVYNILSNRCHIVSNRYVLLEFPYDFTKEKAFQYVDVLVSRGYIPIIAHVERYQCLRKKKVIRELIDNGAMIQVNADSIMGNNGLFTKRFVRSLLNSELIDLVGSDCHHPVRRPCRYKACAEYIKRHCSNEYAEKILFQNPRMIISMETEGEKI